MVWWTVTHETADQIAQHLDPAVEWPYIVLPILELPQFNGWRVDVVNAKTLGRVVVIDVLGRMPDPWWTPVQQPATGSIS